MRSGSPGTATLPQALPQSRRILPNLPSWPGLRFPGLMLQVTWNIHWRGASRALCRERSCGHPKAALRGLYLRDDPSSTPSSSRSGSAGLQLRIPKHKAMLLLGTLPPTHPPTLPPSHPQQLLGICRESPPRVDHLHQCMSNAGSQVPLDLQNHNFSRYGPGISVFIRTPSMVLCPLHLGTSDLHNKGQMSLWPPRPSQLGSGLPIQPHFSQPDSH